MSETSEQRHLVIEQEKIGPGVWKSKHSCPPHVWYYADKIMHWCCSECKNLAHEKPKADKENFFREEVTYTRKE